MAVTTSSVAGIVSGRNPLEYEASAPWTLFLFQVILITAMCQILHYPLKKLRQPRVIAEVLSGIILGPSVMGRIPKFTSTCFPPESKPGLSLVANVGIILFLFIIGMEVDLKFVRKNYRSAFSVGLINMAIPFALGCGIAKGLYQQYRQNNEDMPPIEFTTYMVFIAVAMCVTAFPVLARILVELNLIGDKIGTIVLSAGIINDLIGWILLALVVSLANSGSGVNTVYILLLTVAWFFFLAYPVRYALKYYYKRFTNEMVTGEPSHMLMVLLIGLVFTSAFYTDIIGVHPIFGAFMVGVLVPRDNGYVVRVTEKLEDIVHIVMIPVYFVIAGLGVNLGDLNHGIDWAYTIGIIALAMVGKVAGGLMAAKLNGLFWRESLAVGVLMSCKGIVEIVVLNVGLNAEIISERVYSMFIVMTLITTFLTTPLALWVYPQSYRERSHKKKGLDSDEAALLRTQEEISVDNFQDVRFSAVVLLLNNIDTIPQLMLLLKNLQTSKESYQINAIHLREFTTRTSHLLEASSKDEANFGTNDHDQGNFTSIMAIFTAFSSILNMKSSIKSILTPVDSYAVTAIEQIGSKSDLLLSSIPASSLTHSPEGIEIIENQYKQLFSRCWANVGVLITSHGGTWDQSKTVHCVLNHNNFLSSSDLLCLNIVSLLAKTYPSIHVHVSSSTGASKEFEHQFDSQLKSSGPKVDLTVSYFKDFNDLISTSSRKELDTAQRIFVVPYDFAECAEVLKISRLGQQELYDDILVVKSHSESTQ